MTPKQSLINENRKLFYTITSLEKNVIDLSKKTFKEIDDPESTLSLDELFNDKESYSIWKNNFCGCVSYNFKLPVNNKTKMSNNRHRFQLNLFFPYYKQI